MKINLLLDMVGQILIANRPRPDLMSIRFNTLGAVWQHKGTLPAANALGVLEVYLRECVIDPLRLIGTVISVTDATRVKVKFEPPGQQIAI